MIVADLSYFMIGCLTICFFLLAVVCLLGIVRTPEMKIGFFVRPFFTGMLVISAIFMQGFECVCVQTNTGGVSLWIVEHVLALPVWFVLAVLLLLTAGVSIGWILTEQKIRVALTPASLQEGLDYMPDGISFSTDEGIPLLVNRKMQDISDAAFGTGVLDMKRLRQRLEAGDLLTGSHTESRGEALFLHLPDETTWDIRFGTLSVGNAKVQECIAYDITEQYRKSQEMETRNVHLAAVNEKIRAYNRNLDAITRDWEILETKIRIHDDVGRSLLTLRSYLASEDGNRKNLVDQWRFTVAALKREEVFRDTGDRMEALVEAAEAVGVKLVFAGEIPKIPEVQEVAAAAIHECLTNTVKHADGNEVTINTRTENGAVTMELKNNGKQPEGKIEEKGGLRTLRIIVEQHHGQMEILVEPEFVLRIKMEFFSVNSILF